MNKSAASPSRCACCGIDIPFDDPRVTTEMAEQMRPLIRGGNTITAITELKRLANLSLRDAKYWVDHCGEINVPGLRRGPCPFCGEELRTKDARQCRHCKRDWHDPDNVLVLGTNEPFTES